MIFKVKLYSDSKENPLLDFYIKAESITGFYVPSKSDEELVDDETEGINIFHEGGISTIKQEKHITDYLYQKFVKPSIEI